MHIDSSYIIPFLASLSFTTFFVKEVIKDWKNGKDLYHK